MCVCVVYSKWNAIKAQFGTAIAAVLGTAIGLCALRNKHLEQSMLAVCAGGMVYIAVIGMLPDVYKAVGKSNKQRMFEICAFVSGWLLMQLIVEIEGHDHHHE